MVVAAQLGLSVAATVIAIFWVTAAPNAYDISNVVLSDGLGLYAIVLAVLVVRRRPHLVIGPLLGLYGLVSTALTMSDVYDDMHAQLPARFPVSPWWVAFGTATFMLWSLPTILLVLYFPNGRLLSPRWRWLIVAFCVDFLALSIVQPFVQRAFDPPYQDMPNPLPAAHGGWAVAAWSVVATCLAGFMTILVLSVIAVVRRFRRAEGIARRQLKWFLLGACTLPAGLLVCWIDGLLFGSNGGVLTAVALFVVQLAVPTATTIGLLRHELYDVDRAVAATVTYAVVTSILVGLFGLTSVVAGVALGRSSPWVAAVATAVCAAALSPLRKRLREAVDRKLYPRRRSVLEAISRFRADIRGGRALPEDLEGVLSAALQDPDVRIDYLLDEVGYTGSGPATVAPGGVPVMIADYRVGVLVAGSRTSPQLLREVAHSSAFLVEAVRMRLGLANALQEVASSRSRLLQAGYEERRRLERDLHDGAQQRLVALGMNLRVAQRHLGDGTVDVDGLLDESVGELGTAVAELRQIAHGLRPSSLDDGLGPALTSMISRLPVTVGMKVHAGPVPDDVATTAFFVASEAVTNAIKHAQAERIDLDVRHDSSGLVVTVSDNGCGRAEVRMGAGLAGLSDRVAAAGGRLQVRSRPGLGTSVEAFLPCAS